MIQPSRHEEASCPKRKMACMNEVMLEFEEKIKSAACGSKLEIVVVGGPDKDTYCRGANVEAAY
jgi:hypothetical protein